ncbi:hypothetical protein M899_1973 [Bacteriovorax sp. BSW11_IV]|uniref:hypothetical protein n=1 Tax=Bacteriovorax sp. BSW11_IV TaxID=1353529 RepID=UPI00038A324D|nr:hypothetical protein [Bacteriovorax sp. BSW11_IV]EQC46479.1 hypothetical protein M899_1973 [Bacteriovorax sp. BSW11_IV]
MKTLLLTLAFSVGPFTFAADKDVYGCFSKIESYCKEKGLKDCSFTEMSRNVDFKQGVGSDCFNIMREQDEISKKEPVYECMEFLKNTGCEEKSKMNALDPALLKDTKKLNAYLQKQSEVYQQCLKESASKLPARCREKMNL